MSMRRLFLLSASFCVLGVAGCSSVTNMFSKDDTPPVAEAAQAEAAPNADSLVQEQKEINALMGEQAPLPEQSVAQKDVPPPPVADLKAEDAPKVADDAPALDEQALAECPEVQVLPDTKSITYFDDPEGKPTGALVARAALVDIRGGCSYTGDSVSVDVDMIMKGKITDKGRYQGRRDLEAFMTFPYFVAVMDDQGHMIDKKIMATAMRFKPMIDDLDHAEKITQTIALPDTSKGPQYTIAVGFQLNRAQLQYNRGGTSATKSEPAKTEPTAAQDPSAKTSAGAKMQPIEE